MVMGRGETRGITPTGGTLDKQLLNKSCWFPLETHVKSLRALCATEPAADQTLQALEQKDFSKRALYS